jgi:hypothetical protein
LSFSISAVYLPKRALVERQAECFEDAKGKSTCVSRVSILDALPFGRLRYDTPDRAIGYAMHRSRSHDAVIRVYDDAGNVIETHEHVGDFRES